MLKEFEEQVVLIVCTTEIKYNRRMCCGDSGVQLSLSGQLH